MEELLYCIEILRERHNLLKRDSLLLARMGRYEEAVDCRNCQKKIERIVSKFLFEIEHQIVADNDAVRCKRLKEYFGLDFVEQHAKLTEHLKYLQGRLKSLVVAFNFRLANKIRVEITETEHLIKKISSNGNTPHPESFK